MLHLDPCIPTGWPGFEIRYRHRSATYRIAVDNSVHAGRGVCAVELDGEQLPDNVVPLSDDGGAHTVRVRLG
jgi:cellobiose phosphorylase